MNFGTEYEPKDEGQVIFDHDDAGTGTEDNEIDSSETENECTEVAYAEVYSNLSNVLPVSRTIKAPEPSVRSIKTYQRGTSILPRENKPSIPTEEMSVVVP